MGQRFLLALSKSHHSATNLQSSPLRFFSVCAGEFFYSSRSQSWNKTTFQAGADFPFHKHFDFELYYEHDNNVGSTPNTVNALGLTAYIYF